MNNFKLFCITNIQAKELEDLPLDLVGVGRNKFNDLTTSYYLISKRKERAGIFR